MLGPVLERLNGELLDPLIDRTFAIMARRGLLPEPPEELQDVELKVEYISILAQAQRLVATAGIERLSTFVGGLAGVKPEVLDKFDADQTVDEYAQALGTPPTMIRSDIEVEKIRAGRAEKEQMAQMAAMAEPALQASQAAKNMSETDVNGVSALDRLAQGAGSIPPPQ